jgi:methionyl-tRNA formyltransferase
MVSNKEKRNLRIVFMGTPDFAVAGLSALTEAGYAIVGVITAPDRPAGRGRKLQESAVKRFALTKGLKVLQPTNLKDESFIKELKTLKPNLQVVVAFRMLPKVVWQLPEFGTFNLHASLLPQYRGAAPINWAIINGEETTGVTTFFIDEKIDTGEIILQEETDIHYDDDAGSLHDRLMTLGAAVILKTVGLIEKDKVTTQTQPQSDELKTAPKIFREDCKIDWAMSGRSIYNFVRGLSPYPTAWCSLKNGQDELSIKIYRTAFEKETHQLQAGAVLSTKDSLKIAVTDGFIELLTIQLPGKRKMTVNEVLNGFKLEEDAHVL